MSWNLVISRGVWKGVDAFRDVAGKNCPGGCVPSPDDAGEDGDLSSSRRSRWFLSRSYRRRWLLLKLWKKLTLLKLDELLAGEFKAKRP
jgi:hypothetical protein